MYINEQILKQVGRDVCQSMLGLPIGPFTSRSHSARQLLASVEIHGKFRRAVEITADQDLAAAIAEVMFASIRETLDASDISDALGEIANMIGGNLKGIIGDEAELSLPIVIETDVTTWTDNPQDIRTTIYCCGHPLTIVLRAPTLRLTQAIPMIA